MDSTVFPLFSTPLYMGFTPASSRLISIAESKEYSKEFYSINSILPYDIEELKTAIIPHCNNFFYNVLNLENSFNYKFSDGWFVKSDPGEDRSNNHFHSNSLYSGVYYIDVATGSGDIIFNRNDSPSLPNCITIGLPVKNNGYNFFNSEVWRVSPKSGNILIFPSSLKHYFLENNSKTRRLSYSFNIVPVGKLGFRVGNFLSYT